MKNCKKYISIFLLLVFQWIFFPGSVLHEVFADHHDTECFNTHDGELTLEQAHTHCAIFEIHAPVYDVPGLIVLDTPLPQVIGSGFYAPVNPYYIPGQLNLPSRAPPTV
jgi:hypothetical protein